MKRTRIVQLSALILAAITFPMFSRAQSGYSVTERGPDWKVHQKTTVENGTNRVHSYTELATGLNYQNSYGQWTESKEQITILPGGGAQAVEGRHKVYFPGNIHNGPIEVITPDGRHLFSRPLGISYDDGSNTVFVAQLKSAVGYLTASNQVTYRDAFTGFKADLVCTYRRGGFECDLVFRQQPPAPGDYGLDTTFTALQLVTEFFNTQDPQQISGAYDEWFGLQDVTLKFGKLTMMHGKAFAFRGTNSSQSTISSELSSPVYKSWVKAEGRTFLVESVPVLDIAENLEALPLQANLQKPATGSKKLASAPRQFPAASQLGTSTNQIQLALNEFNQEPGVVLDYTTVDSDQTDFTFVSGTTYWISGWFNISGTAIFEGGTVLKYLQDNSSALGIFGSLVWETTADHPAVLTSENDDSVGEPISGSTGTPATAAWATYLYVDVSDWASDVHFEHCRLRYAGGGVNTDDSNPFYFNDVQFVQCNEAVAPYTSIVIRNALISHCNTYFGGYFPLVCENVTIDQGDLSYGGNAYFTNCIFSSVTNTYGADGDHNGFYDSPPFGTSPTTNTFFPFQTAGAAPYYLASGCSFRNAGTTDINADLLVELQTMTTYAPQDGSLPDNNTPDLGYHYPVNEDFDYDGIPDWWEWKWFGRLSQNATDDSFNPSEELLYDTTLSVSNGVLPSWRDFRTTPIPDGMALGILIQTNYPFELTRIEAEVLLENPESLSDTELEVGFFRNTNQFALGMYVDPDYIASDVRESLSKTLTDLGNGHWLLSLELPTYGWGTNRVVTIRTVPNSDGTMTKMSFIGCSGTIPGIKAYATDNTTTNMVQVMLPKMKVWRRMLAPTRLPSFPTPITDFDFMTDLELTWLPGYQLGSTTNFPSVPFNWQTDELHMWTTILDDSDGPHFFLTRPDPTE
jgi:hypothetical protein